MARLNEIKKQAELFSDQVHKLEKNFCKDDFKPQDFAPLKQYVDQLALR